MPASAIGAATAPAAEDSVLLEALPEAVPVPDEESDLVAVALDVAVDSPDAVPDDDPDAVPVVAAVSEPVVDALPVPVAEAPEAVSVEVRVGVAMDGPQAETNEDWRDSSATVALLS